MIEEDYMMLAIEQAKRAMSIDEVPIGAVIVDKYGKIIGEGYNQSILKNDPTSHAEINAIRMAALTIGNYRLIGTTLYSTIEPCIMCMGAIINARISRVVFGADDPKWGAVVSLYKIATDNRFNHRPKILSGICKREASALIKRFFAEKRSNQ